MVASTANRLPEPSLSHGLERAPHDVRALLNERPLPPHRLPLPILCRRPPLPRRHGLGVGPVVTRFDQLPVRALPTIGRGFDLENANQKSSGQHRIRTCDLYGVNVAL
jgi:hypothetical protein